MEIGTYFSTRVSVHVCLIPVSRFGDGGGFGLKEQVRSFREGSPRPLCFLNSSHFAWGSAAKPGS